MSIAIYGRDALTLVLTGKDIREFKEILARGLNTAPPEKYPDWLKLADKLSAPELPSINPINPINPINS